MVEVGLNIDDGIDRKELSRLRERFLSVNHKRLQRVHLALTPPQQSVLRLLPLFLHINHPQLPGYLSDSTPAGISGYKPDAELIEEARDFAKNLNYKPSRRDYETSSVSAVFLLGSAGSIAYAEDSSMDLWLFHRPGLTVKQLQALREKCDLLQTWAATLGAHVTLFLIDSQQFSRAQYDIRPLLLDEQGAAQHGLLLDEFYRTGLWLAGRTPVWWLVPAKHEHRYKEYCAHLLATASINKHLIDLGGLEQIAVSELMSAGMWRLYKGIEAPYQSLLQLLLIELYLTESDQLQTLSSSYKDAIYNNQLHMDALNIDELDPYVMLYRRLENYLLGRAELQRLELLRRCFYLMVGQRVTQAQLRRSNSWQLILLEKFAYAWGWRAVLLSHLDRRPQWKAMQVQSEQGLLVHELMHSYRLLGQYAQRAELAGYGKDLALLGRYLYVAFDPKAGKIEYLNPNIADNLAEDTLTLVQCIPTAPESAYWGLFRGSLVGLEWQARLPIQRGQHLVAVLAWAYLNGVISDSTQLSLALSDSALSDAELRNILKSLHNIFPRPLVAMTEETLLNSSYPDTVLLLLNVGHAPDIEHERSSEFADALSVAQSQDNLLFSIDQVSLNSWNELSVRHYRGEQALIECLSQLLSACHARSADVQIHVGSFCQYQAAALVQRVEQVVAQAFKNIQQGTAVRYVLRVKQALHVLEWRAGPADYQVFANKEALATELAQEQAHFIRWRIDGHALQGDVLKYILPVGHPDKVQVFYRVQDGLALIYVLDERNSLWQHSEPFINEDHLLVPLQRFFSALLQRRAMAVSFAEAYDENAPFSVNYHRIFPDGQGSPERVERCQLLGANHQLSFYALQAVYRNDGGVVLYYNGRAFAQSELGVDVYRTVVRAILDQQQGAPLDNQLCRITDVELSEVKAPDRLQTLHYLECKTLLEQHLNAALQSLRKH